MKGNKFDVGDIVTGSDDNTYRITTKGSVLKVISLVNKDGSVISVRLIKAARDFQKVLEGNEYPVSASQFKLKEYPVSESEGKLKEESKAAMPKIKQAKNLVEFSMTELIHMISDKLGIKPQAFKLQPLALFRLRTYTSVHRGEVIEHDLSEYFIDEEGTMYSRHNDTYFTKFGQRLTRLSDASLSKSGKIVNSFRDKKGKKVTISRENIKKLMRAGQLEDVTLLSLEDEKVSGLGQLEILLKELGE